VEHLLQFLTRAAAAHQALALALVGGTALAESLAIVGTIVPAAVVMFTAGALVGQGSLALGLALGCAAAGAIVGDGLSYELGRRSQGRVRGWPAVHRHQAAMERAERFIRRHGAMSVLLARFTGAVRAFVPLLAGFAPMPRGRFYVTNVLSALLWAPAHILPGVVFGTSLQLAEAASGRLVLLLAALTLVAWATVWITTRSLRWLVPYATRIRGRIVQSARSRDTRLSHAVLALLDPQRHGSRALLAGLGLLVGSMWLFLGVIEDIVSKDPLIVADHAVFAFLQQMRTDLGDRVMVAVTEMGSVGVLLPVIVAVLGWLAWHRAWRTAGYWVGIAATAELLVQVLRQTLGRTRPLQLYQGVERFSFPSGHATVSVVVLGFLAFLLTRGQGMRWRVLVATGAALYVVLVAFSRLYLGAHWFSDVLGGMSFGLAWVAFVAMVYTQRRISEPLAVRPMAALALGTIVVAAIVWLPWRGPADLRRYSVHLEPQAMTAAAWRSDGWRALPQRRHELAGEEREPLPLQWACGPAPMERALAAAGWHKAPSLSIETVLLALAPHTPLERLPVLPRFDGGRPSSLVLARPTTNAAVREILRLWRSDVVLVAPSGSRVPVWYGAASSQRRSGPHDVWVSESPVAMAPIAAELARQAGIALADPVRAQRAGDAPQLLLCADR
jgi:membrane protein DedA with SNARE-associated domain/membrane-associated phospholipid phosphatase